MDNSKKYTLLNIEGENVFEFVKRMTSEGKMPLYCIKKIREKFPFLSLADAKEIVIISTTEHKSLFDHQADLFSGLENLDLDKEWSDDKV